MPSIHQNAILRSAALAVAGLTLAGCESAAWVKGANEPDLVDATRGGIEVYDGLVSDVTTRILEDFRARPDTPDHMNVAFIGVENKSAEEMRDARDAVYEEINSILVNEKAGVMVNRRFVETIMQKNGLRPEDLFLKSGRERFVQEASAEGIVPDYLLFSTVTSLTSEGLGEAQRNYQMTLELVDAHSGQTLMNKLGRVRKGYNK